MGKEQLISLENLARLLEEYLNVSTILDCCPNGIQIEGKKGIGKIATAVSANLMTIEQAAKDNVDALIVHHGIFWKGDDYPIKGSLKKKIKILLENEISLLAYHLPLDMHQEIGNNWKAAKDLGWEELKPFGNYNGKAIGVKGEFKKISIDVFVSKIEDYYFHKATMACGGSKEVSSGALVSGGAYKMLFEAAEEGLDCFMTGNFDEPAWSIAHEQGINFFALGHSATERVGPKALAAYLEQTLQVACHFIDIKNPF